MAMMSRGGENGGNVEDNNANNTAANHLKACAHASLVGDVFVDAEGSLDKLAGVENHLVGRCGSGSERVR